MHNTQRAVAPQVVSKLQKNAEQIIRSASKIYWHAGMMAANLMLPSKKLLNKKLQTYNANSLHTSRVPVSQRIARNIPDIRDSRCLSQFQEHDRYHNE